MPGRTMRAWAVPATGRLEPVELPVPRPAADELLVRVRACGVCRTDLHVRDGELPARRSPVVPGHEAVGIVVAAADSQRASLGERVGVPWLRSTCGSCSACRAGHENLCRASTYTGWDADGGYAEYVAAPWAYTYPIPPGLDPVQAAPLLCAGIIGYRALSRAAVPAGGRLGIYGFGASAHLTAQVAIARGTELHVVTRDPRAREFALELGAATAAVDSAQLPPLDAAIIFAPAGELVADALEALAPAGTVALAGIHMSQIAALDYDQHLFHEKTLTSVTANTRADGDEFLRLADRLGVRATVSPYPFERADEALAALAADAVHGAAVLVL